MPRPRKNFKIRPPKFLGLHQYKFQRNGTYVGHYKGPPISQRRLEYARQPRPSVYLPFVSAVVGSALSKSRPLEALSSKDDSCVYLFSNVKTNQVIYSRFGHIDPKDALPQLVFYGKKTVPEKYRKDDWRPFTMIQLRSKLEADHVFSTLRDLRLLRDYAWRKPGSIAPNKSLRKRMLMNQIGTAVCDLSTAIDKADIQLEHGQLDKLLQWKAVEALAFDARTGGLAVLRKQLKRAQRFVAGKKLSKKLRRMDKEVIADKMKAWYIDQAMMQNAVLAVNRLHQASTAAKKKMNSSSLPLDNVSDTPPGNLPSNLPSSPSKNLPGNTLDHSFSSSLSDPLDQKPSLQEIRAQRETRRRELRETSTLAGQTIATPKPALDTTEASGQADDTDIQSETVLDNTIKEHTIHQQQRAYVLHDLLPWMINRLGGQVLTAVVQEDHASTTNQLEASEQGVAKDDVASIQKLLPIWDLQTVDENSSNSDYLQQNYDRKYLTDPTAIKVFWNGIEDRKYTTNWHPSLEHRPMGPLMGIDQYFFRSPVWYLENASAWESFPFYLGNTENTGEEPKSRADRQRLGLFVDAQKPWAPLTKKEIKKHRKGKTGAARKKWRIMMGYEADTESFVPLRRRITNQENINSRPHIADRAVMDQTNIKRVRHHYGSYLATLAQKSRKQKSTNGTVPTLSRLIASDNISTRIESRP